MPGEYEFKPDPDDIGHLTPEMLEKLNASGAYEPASISMPYDAKWVHPGILNCKCAMPSEQGKQIGSSSFSVAIVGLDACIDIPISSLTHGEVDHDRGVAIPVDFEIMVPNGFSARCSQVINSNSLDPKIRITGSILPPEETDCGILYRRWWQALLRSTSPLSLFYRPPANSRHIFAKWRRFDMTHRIWIVDINPVPEIRNIPRG